MSNLKYKLLLCVVAVMVLTVPLYAMDAPFWTENFDAAAALPDGWTVSAGGDWNVGVPVAVGGDPGAAVTAPNVLGYKLGGTGLYANSVSSAKFARTAAIDCSGKVGVKLVFKRWLTVEDSQSDQATIEVSTDNVDWTSVWINPSSGDVDAPDNTVDTSWKDVEYDISAVADDQATVYVRWGLKTNGTVQFGGWNIDDVALTASAPDSIATVTWTPDAGSEWEFLPPAVGTSGQLADWDNDPLTPNTLGGADPAADSSGGTAPIWGTLVGANYATGLDPQYLTSSAFDCIGHSGVAVSFMRWLQIADGAFDQASIQVQVDSDLDTPGFQDVELVSDDSTVELDATTKTHVYEIDTTDFYSLSLSVEYALAGMAAGNGFKVWVATSNSADAADWTQIGATDTTDTLPDETELIETSTPLGVEFSNDTLFVKVELVAAADDTATATVSNLTVSGQNWIEVFHNDSGTPVLKNTFDKDWTPELVSIAGQADGAESVRVRFAIGPTGTFPVTYGGWSLDKLDIVEASREFRAMGVDAPAAMVWEDEGDATVTLKNTGTATWDSSISAFEATAKNQEVPDLENPTGPDIVVAALDVFPINRWNVGSIAVGDDDTVAPDATYDFSATITAPPLSAVVYKAPITPTSAGDAGLSVLGLDWVLGNETAAGLEAIPTFADGSIATGGVKVTRFPDDQVGQADGGWARFWIEELAGVVPYVVKGFPNGTYGPKVTVDRAAIAVYIAHAAQVPTSAAGATLGDAFRDVPADYWAALWIEECAGAGIVTGFGDETYHPAELITREGMCKLVVNGVNFFQGPGTIPVPPLDTLVQADYPFADIVAEDDPDTTANEQDPLAGFVLAAFDAGIVKGFPLVPPATKPNFQPTLTLTRDQLAVFVWNGFLRDFPAVVALGGPGITDVIVGSDLVANEAPYSGFASLTGTIQADDDATAYVTFDALRMDGRGDTDVTFDFTGGSVDHSTTITIPAVQIAGWADDVLNGDTDGEPYKTVAVPLDTSDHGAYTLTVSVDGIPLLRQPELKIMGSIFLETMDAGNPGWEVTGTPSTVGMYGPTNDPDQDNTDLFDGELSMELQGVQAVQFGQSTVDFHDIRLLADVAAVDLADDDTITFSWSKDSGATWTVAGTITGADAPGALDTVSFDLPNGDPEADPVVVGADDNGNFMVKIAVDVAGADGRVYIDNVELRGT